MGGAIDIQSSESHASEEAAAESRLYLNASRKLKQGEGFISDGVDGRGIDRW